MNHTLVTARLDKVAGCDESRPYDQDHKASERVAQSDF